jgi:hypothetical protein
MHPREDFEVPQHPSRIIWLGVDGVIDKMLTPDLERNMRKKGPKIHLYIYVGVPGLSLAVHLCFKIRAACCVLCKDPLYYIFLFNTKTTLIYELFAVRSLGLLLVP